MVAKKLLLPLLIFAGLLFGGGICYRAALSRPSRSTETAEITIPAGMGVAEISALLFENKLIRSEGLFKLYLRLNDLGATLEAGEYSVPPRLSLPETVALLQHGTFDLKATFPEGWRREEMAEYLGELMAGVDDTKITESGFLSASVGMEGYLFPETYFVSREASAEEVVILMRGMFDKKFGDEWRRKAEERGLSVEEVVILASIVEREVTLAEDRAKVAGILIKRWKNGWPLEADATIQYALATSNYQLSAIDDDFTWWPERLTKADLAIDSPYNTRKYRGLPPAPVCNPGLATLTAVVDYEETPYWFYVSDKEGKIHFSKTLDEHNQQVLQYVR